MDDTNCHTPPLQGSDISSKHLNYDQNDYLVLTNYTSFTQMLSFTYISLHHSPNMFFLIPRHLRIFQHNEQYQHGNCRILADCMRIWHLECHHCIPPILGRRPPVTLGVASERVYHHFFWTSTSHTLCQLSEETLFGHFVLALNAAFTQQLSLADEGYESGSNEDLPTPLCK